MQKLALSIDDLPYCIKVEDVAKLMGISRGTAFKVVKDHNFPAVRVGKRIIVLRDNFINWLEEQSTKPL